MPGARSNASLHMVLRRSADALTRHASMSTSQPPAVVAVVEDDAPSRIALGRLIRAAGFEPALFDSAGSLSRRLTGADVHRCRRAPARHVGHRVANSGSAPPTPRRPIIVTTSSHETVIRERAQQNGCAAFFRKPVDGNVT